MSAATLKTVAIAVVSACLLAGPVAAQRESSEALKAAIIYNIVRFVDFPPSAVRSVLQLCILQQIPQTRAIANLNGRHAGDRTITVRTIDPAASSGCDVVYVGSVATSSIAAMHAPGVLLIGDGSRFVGDGGTIGLVTMGSQTRFEINIGQARKARLNVSSQLLRLAVRVQE